MSNEKFDFDFLKQKVPKSSKSWTEFQAFAPKFHFFQFGNLNFHSGKAGDAINGAADKVKDEVGNRVKNAADDALDAAGLRNNPSRFFCFLKQMDDFVSNFHHFAQQNKENVPNNYFFRTRSSSQEARPEVATSCR